jgi:hypothetical protein
MIACVSASRRGTEVIDFVIATAAGQPIGRFADGRVAELFLDAAKVDPLPPELCTGRGDRRLGRPAVRLSNRNAGPRSRRSR